MPSHAKYGKRQVFLASQDLFGPYYAYFSVRAGQSRGQTGLTGKSFNIHSIFGSSPLVIAPTSLRLSLSQDVFFVRLLFAQELGRHAACSTAAFVPLP